MVTARPSRPSRPFRSRPARGPAALGAGLVTASLVLLPAGAARAETTIPLTADVVDSFVYYLDEDPVTVSPGSTLLVPPPPAGTEWETGFEFLLFDVSEFGDLGEAGEAAADVPDEPVEPVEPGELPGLPEELPGEPGDVAALAEEVDEDLGLVDGGTVEAGDDGGVRVELPGDVPEATYVGTFFATGDLTEVLYAVTLEIVAGEPATVTLDYADAETFTFALSVTVVARGERVTLLAPTGVDLGGYDLELGLPEDEDLDFPSYLPDELTVEYAADGTSVTFVVPDVLPDQEDGSEPGPLPDGTALEVYLYSLAVDEDGESLSGTDYLVTGLTVGSGTTPTATATTRPPIPTAVPAGAGPLPGDVPQATSSTTGPVTVGLLAAGLVVAGLVAGVRTAVGRGDGARRRPSPGRHG